MLGRAAGRAAQCAVACPGHVRDMPRRATLSLATTSPWREVVTAHHAMLTHTSMVVSLPRFSLSYVA